MNEEEMTFAENLLPDTYRLPANECGSAAYGIKDAKGLHTVIIPQRDI